jgi:hypothetical protein
MSDDIAQTFVKAMGMVPSTNASVWEMDLAALRSLVATADVREDIRTFVEATQELDSSEWCRISQSEIALLR